MFRRLRSPDPRLEWAIVVVLAAAGELEIWLGDAMDALSRPAGGLLWLLLALSFAWRRRAPLVPLAALVANVAAFGLAAGPEPPSAQVFVAALLAFYSAGSHGSSRLDLAGTAAVAAMLVALDVSQVAAGTEALWAAAGAWLLLATAWLGGRALRRQRIAAADLAERARRLEQEREERAQAAVAEERARMARELHDVVTHSVGVMVVQAQAGQRLLEGDEPAAREAFAAIESAGRAALAEMRRLLGLLRPVDGTEPLAPVPSIERLDSLVGQLRTAGLSVEVEVKGEPRRLPPGIASSAYRVVQEALTNVLKHAHGARALVVLEYRAQSLDIDVLDDGIGGSHVDSRGQGLLGMQERVALLGGTLESGARAGGGFRVHASLPFDLAPA